MDMATRALLCCKPTRWAFVTVAAFIFVLYTLQNRHTSGDLQSLDLKWSSKQASLFSQPDSTFFAFPFAGWVNTGHPSDFTCESMKKNSVIAVENGWLLTDNIRQIADSLENDPLVVDAYEEKRNSSSEDQEKIRDSWTRLSGSSVWLPEQEVFLVVTRVIFYAHGNRQWPFRSWLRGQIFDKSWKEILGHSITVGGNTVQFPTVFDIPIDFKRGDIFFGPEDPRVILEEGVSGAEPVIIFNMLTKRFGWRRAMHVYRPFSQKLAGLTIVGRKREDAKNWAPFFIPPSYSSAHVSRPSDDLHFVVDFNPVHVIKCNLDTGDCDYVFEPKKVDGVGLMRGGTNWVPIPFMDRIRTKQNERVNAWVSFPRTVIEKTCGDRFYRPELMVMVNIGKTFYMAYVSTPLDFGTALITIEEGDNPCEKGRILTPNSIAQWATNPSGVDVMTLTLSVDDKSTQVMRIGGLLDLLFDLPIMQALRQSRLGGVVEHHDELHTKLLFAKTKTILDCAIKSSSEQADAIRTLYDLPDPKEEERKKEEEERKKKEAEDAELKKKEEEKQKKDE